MSRPNLEPVPVKPSIDVYTGLLAVALAAVLFGLVVLFLRYNALFPNTPLWQ